MTPEFVGIPEEFQPLYICTARESLSKALNIIQNSNLDKQKELLSTPEFYNIVNSALIDLDEHRPVFEDKIVNAFEQNLQPIATVIFSE